MAGFLSPHSRSPVSKPHSKVLIYKVWIQCPGFSKEMWNTQIYEQTYFVATMYAQGHTYGSMCLVPTPCRILSTVLNIVDIAPCGRLKRAYLSFPSVVGSFLSLFHVGRFYLHCTDPFMSPHVSILEHKPAYPKKKRGMFLRSFPLGI